MICTAGFEVRRRPTTAGHLGKVACKPKVEARDARAEPLLAEVAALVGDEQREEKKRWVVATIRECARRRPAR